MQEPRKNATSDKGAPSIDQAVIDSVFPLTRPDWDFNTAEGHKRKALPWALGLAVTDAEPPDKTSPAPAPPLPC